jgi:hypothetical protein
VSNNKDGYRKFRLEKEPNKKRKTACIVIDVDTGEVGPIPMDILQGWGIECGVPPGELTPDALMSAPNPSANDESSA